MATGQGAYKVRGTTGFVGSGREATSERHSRQADDGLHTTAFGASDVHESTQASPFSITRALVAKASVFLIVKLDTPHSLVDHRLNKLQHFRKLSGLLEKNIMYLLIGVSVWPVSANDTVCA